MRYLPAARVADAVIVISVRYFSPLKVKAFVFCWSRGTGMDVSKMKVDVIGGHAGTTIMPLLSQVKR